MDSPETNPDYYCDCDSYDEDKFTCYSDGSPKGQCEHCGDKWFWHRPETLPEHERAGTAKIRAYQLSLLRKTNTDDITKKSL